MGYHTHFITHECIVSMLELFVAYGKDQMRTLKTHGMDIVVYHSCKKRTIKPLDRSSKPHSQIFFRLNFALTIEEKSL